MNLKKALGLLIGVACGATLANAGTLSFTCDPGGAAATCDYLNTTIAGNYASAFTNVNANIYIQYGTTGLGSSTTGFNNEVTYAQYAGALASAATASGNPVQVAAVAALANDISAYGAGDVEVTSALASALGIGADVIGGNTGTTSGGSACSTPGGSGCYNGIITITNDPGTPLYYDNLGGSEPAGAFDYYAVVEREADAILGTSSCITTRTNPLSDNCPGNFTPSAVDLFRYSSPGSLVLDSALSTTPGAYFSYNGGTTNGANGFSYNTLDNGDDYADFVSSCTGGPFSVQDAEGCPGHDKGLSILNDGGAEINILNAVGFDVPTTTNTTPEPGTVFLLGAGLAAAGAIHLARLLARVR